MDRHWWLLYLPEAAFSCPSTARHSSIDWQYPSSEVECWMGYDCSIMAGEFLDPDPATVD